MTVAIRICPLFLLAWSAFAHAIPAQYDLHLDLDNDAATGCQVATPDGPVDGVEAILTTFMETSGLNSASVVGVERRNCVDPATDSFDAPQLIDAGGWDVGVGNGLDGFNVIETFMPVSPLSAGNEIKIVLVASDTAGNTSVVGADADAIVLPGVAPVVIPTLTFFTLLLLGLLMLGIGVLVIKRQRRLTLFAVVMLSSGSLVAATCVLDGEISDWSMDALLAETPATDPANGVDIRALFGKRADNNNRLCFRIDSALLFASSPVTQDDQYDVIGTSPLNVAQADGVLSNDDLGFPEGDLIGFGGGDLAGAADANPPGTTVTVGVDGSLALNADGSLQFQAESGFSGAFTFQYRVENTAGISDATVTIEVQSQPQANDVSFEVLSGESLNIPAPGVLDGASGVPMPQVQSFGGGDLGGSVADNAAGDSVVVGADGSLTLSSDGSLVFQPPSGTTGDLSFQYQASNTVGDDIAAVTVTINQPPTITSADSLDCEVGAACPFTYTADGFPQPDIMLSGALPSGMSFDAASASLQGTPDAGSGQAYPLEITAANGVAPDDVQSFTLTVNEAPAITSVDNHGCELNEPCDFTFAADGFPDPEFSMPGLPAGLSLDSATGVLSGSATVNGEFNLTLTASNVLGNDTQAFTLTIGEAPSITSADNLSCEVGAACDFTVTADGFPAPSFTLAGLPSGLSFDGTTGVLSGTPDAGTGADYNLTLTAENGVAPDDTQAFTLTINEAPAITSADNLSCEIGSSCDFTFTADGFPAPGFTLPGLPSGLSFDSATGVLSGTPDAGTGAVYNLTLTAANGIGADDTQAFTLTINQAPSITSADNLTCEVGAACDFTITADGFPDPSFTLPGLPAGLSFDGNTGVLSGTPDAGTGEEYNLTLTAANGITPDDTQAFTLTINEAPVANDDPAGGIPSNSSPGSVSYHGSFDTVLNVSAADGVLDNDVRGFPQADIATGSPIATGGGGSVTLNADGSFSYSPVSGFTGIDTFQYCIENAGGNDCATVALAVGERPEAADATYPQTLIGNVGIDTTVNSGFSVTVGGDGITLGLDGTTNGDAALNANGTFTFNPAAGVTNANATLVYSVFNGFGGASGTITLPIGADRIWFVDNSAGAGDGRLGSPFNTLAGAESAAVNTGERIFLYTGSGDYSGGITLLDGQRLLGQAGSQTLAAMANVTPPSDSVLPATGGAAPVIVSGGGNGVTLAANNTLQGFTIGDTGLDGTDISGINFGTLTVADLTLTGNGRALNLNNGVLNGNFLDINADGGNTQGLVVAEVGGTWSVTGRVDIGAVANNGIVIFSVPAGTSVSFDGGLAVNKAAPGSAVALVDNAPGASISLGNVAISNTAGRGLTVNNSPVSISGNASTIDVTGGRALDLLDADLVGGATFASSSSTGSSTEGIRIVNGLSGSLTINGGAIGGSTGTAFLVNGDLGGGVSYAGSISKTSAGRLVDVSVAGAGNLDLSGDLSCTGSCATGAGNHGLRVSDRTGGTVSFSGTSKLFSSSATNPGVSLTNNTGATVSFINGGLDIDTTSGTGFNVAGGGTVTVAGASNTVDGTTGTSVSITDTSIGATGVTFQRVSSNGGASPGIVLENTGSSGGLTVTGNGGSCTSAGTCTGGSIRNKTGGTDGIDGISLTNTSNPRFNFVHIASNSRNGIFGSGVNGFELIDSLVESNADQASPDEAGILMNNLTGTLAGGSNPVRILRSTIRDSHEHNIKIENSAGTLADLVIDDSFVRDTPAGTGANGLLLQAIGTASMGTTVTNSSFIANKSNGIQADAGGASGPFVRVDVDNSTFTGAGNDDSTDPAAQNVGVNVSTSSAGSAEFMITNSTFVGHRAIGINFFANANTSAATTVLATITGNTIGTQGVANSGSAIGSGIDISNEGPNRIDVLIDNNIVQGVGDGSFSGFEGIFINDVVNAGTINATVTNNTIRDIFDDRGLVVQERVGGTHCSNITGNSFSNIGGISDMRVRQTAGTHNVVQADPGGAAPNLSSVNGNANITVTGTVSFGFGSTCPTP